MGEKTNIAWCDHTWNPWRGCDRVSPGCDHCYAERWARRNPAVLGEWGPDAPRPLASQSGLEAPYRWNRAAIRAGTVRTVFLGSMMDFCEDRPDLEQRRDSVWQIIQDCRQLMFLILSKRPENFEKFLPWCNGSDVRIWRNVAIGATMEDQDRLETRRGHLFRQAAGLHFVSMEPLLGPIFLAGEMHPDWVIVGGESGPDARPCELDWIGQIVRDCQAAQVPCFVKQLGAKPVKWFWQGECGEHPDGTPMPTESGLMSYPLEDPKGGDPDQWPEDLRVQEFPVWPNAALELFTEK